LISFKDWLNKPIFSIIRKNNHIAINRNQPVNYKNKLSRSKPPFLLWSIFLNYCFFFDNCLTVCYTILFFQIFELFFECIHQNYFKMQLTMIKIEQKEWTSLASIYLLRTSINWTYITHHIGNYRILRRSGMLVIHNNPRHISMRRIQFLSRRGYLRHQLITFNSSCATINWRPIQIIFGSATLSLGHKISCILL